MNKKPEKPVHKTITACPSCRQNIRIPISYKALAVTCPKCKKEFPYEYLKEYGKEGEYRLEIQTGWVLLIAGLTLIDLISFGVTLAMRSYFVAVVIFLSGLFFIPQLIDIPTFSKYRSIQCMVINRQGILFFGKDFLAEEFLSWSDVKAANYVYARHTFLGLVETKREPACVELVRGEKDKIRIPPAMFFSNAERMKIIDEILRHYGSNRFAYGK
jgi:hypothetical protein